jgi:hypothetical protein
VLVGKKCERGGALTNAQIQQWAAASGLTGTDLDAALIVAGAKGWLVHGARPGWQVLTADGWDKGTG